MRPVVYDVPAAIAMYKSGQPQLRVANAFGVSRGALHKRLQQHGVKLRSASEQAVLMAAECTPQQRRARCYLANAAARGCKRPMKYLRARANRLQSEAKMSKRERGWYDCLKKQGVTTVPQYAVYKYNIDLAVVDAKVAIEVHNHWHNTPRKKKQDENKRKHLQRQGWAIVYIYDRQMHGLAHRRLLQLIKDRTHCTPVCSKSTQRQFG